MSPVVQQLLLAATAGVVGFLWGLSELIGAFKNETGRALSTAGAWLLIALNFVAAAFIFLLISAVIPNSTNWVTAVIVGLAWPTVIRNASIKLAQPLQPDATQEQAAIRFEEAYGRVQQLALQLINGTLTRQRMKLVTRAVREELQVLERYARLALIASPLQEEQGMPADNYIDRILKRDVEEEIKKAMLAAFILEHFGRTVLEDFVKDQRKPSAPTTQPIT